ncbi:MAG: homocysteine S-methyltransferase family protein [Xenococcaceae cyanobacterium MO_188.B19]|nr:homocysteine S-methyltransferase family protein [Xenococcaceae cyanobacterium MO_188.B19]
MAQVQTSLLPQLSDKLFLTDGGIETTLIFHEGFHLPYFAAFDLLDNALGYEALHKYFRTYAQLAQKYEVGLILESPTWRASQDWGDKLGYSTAEMAAFNRQAIQLLQEIRDQYENKKTPMVISGCIGPRADGYNPTEFMNEPQAQDYHSAQIETFCSSPRADLVTATTMTYAEEAIGISRAAENAKIPVVISFTVETNGRLPTGQSLENAIEQVDDATNSFPLYYMINCAHPTHFETALPTAKRWSQRIHGLRANASIRSHAELDEAEELDTGNPVALAFHYQQLKTQLPSFNVLGGCCGTDHRHIEEICQVCLPLFLTAPTFF